MDEEGGQESVAAAAMHSTSHSSVQLENVRDRSFDHLNLKSEGDPGPSGPSDVPRIDWGRDSFARVMYCDGKLTFCLAAHRCGTSLDAELA
jgi:hypothetical protein